MNDMKTPSTREDKSLKSRLREEIVKYLIASAYLFVCFCALLFYRAALLEHDGVHYALLSVALVKALIIGKFLLIGDAIRAKLQPDPAGRLGRIAKRVLWLLLILILLTIAEELIVGWIHGQSMIEMESEFRSRSMSELVAEVVLMGLILVPLVATSELSQAIGPGVLRGLVMGSADRGRQVADKPGAGDDAAK
jgi:hypothetical protein